MKLTWEMVYKLKDVYGRSAINRNAFAGEWFNMPADDGFVADGEHTLVYENAMLSTPSYDPMACDYPPYVVWRDDGSLYEFQ